LVRFFVFKNAFISKQNEWTDQLKYCPSLPTTFSSQAIFEFHLEKMTRLWKWSNFGANFRFLRKKWTGDLPNRAASFGTTSNQKEQCPENGECGKTSHLSVSKYFYDFSDMRPSVVMKKNNFIISLLVFRSFFSQQLKRINCSRYWSPVVESSDFSSS